MADEQPALSQVFRLIEQAEKYAALQDKDRETALKYYDADKDVIPNSGEGFSTVVSADLRKHVQKVMPSIMRTILSNDRIVEYHPAGPGDEEGAEDATDYVNAVVVPECNGEAAIRDAIFDALVLKTGILNWCAYRERRVTVQEFTGQIPDVLTGLDAEGDILDLTQAQDGTVSFKLRRMTDTVKTRLRAVPRGSFLIHPEADSIEDSPIVGEKQSVSRSDLVARGYDRDLVWSIPCEDDDSDPNEMARRGDDYEDSEIDVSMALERVEVFDVYVTLDGDDDGIAELHHFVCAHGKGTKGGAGDEARIVLEHGYATEVPYAAVISDYDAHQFEGHSLFEDLRDVQEINTTLMRQTLDNLYQSNDPTPFIQADAVEELDPLYKRVRGQPILLASGRSAAEAVQYQPTPFFADKSFFMKQALDAEAKDRTGITDASGGLPGETLQGMTATGAAMINESAIARTEMLVRNIARGGLRKAFSGLLRLVIAHADQAKMVRLRGQWRQVDPRVWNSEMDCTVNVGLGAGTRERDMMMLQQILGIQQQIIAAFGPDNPMVKPDQLYNTVKKLTETAGFASADPYFTKPDPADIQRRLMAQANKPDPEMQKLQAQMQLEQAKLQMAQGKEQAQMQADLQVKRAEIEADIMAQRAKLESEALLAQQKLAAERDKWQADMALEAEKVRLDRERFELEKMRFLQEQQVAVAGLQESAIAQGGFAQASDISGMISALGTGLSQALAGIQESNAALARALTAPKQLIRGEDGRAIGVQAIM